MTERPTVLFISDCHLCADDSADDTQRRRRVLRFLDTVDPARHHLYIVGDLFDFWFIYRSVIPRRGVEVLARLVTLHEAGLPITFVGGNHDFWAIPLLRDDLGIDTADGLLERVHQGRRLLIAHGDGLGSGDLGYKLLKRVFRNPLCIALYKLIHPDLGLAIARGASRLSRARGNRDERSHIDRLHREIARPAFADGHDLAIFGHFHLPELHQEPAGTMVVLGDWITHFTFLKLEAGHAELWRQTEGGSVELIAAEDSPARSVR
jgi:UDP-2,3-diacylglucosamine hydrolase